jgi:hypothetical protein
MRNASRMWQLIRFLIAGTGVCGVAGVVLQLELRRPTEGLERAGAMMVTDTDGQLRTVSLGLVEDGDALLGQVARLPTVTAVQFEGSGVTVAGLRELAALPQLQSLDLSRTREGTGWLEVIAEFPALRTVYLRRCNWVTDRELTPLSRLKTLENLILSEGDISDQALAALAQSGSLKHLRVDGCPQIGDAGLRFLAERSRLVTVSINDCPRVSSDGIRALATMPTLRSLSADGIPVLRTVLREIAQSRPDLDLSLDRIEIPEFQPLLEAGALIGLDAAYNVEWVDLDNRRDDLRMIRPILVAPHMEAMTYLAQHESQTLETTDGMLRLLTLVPEAPAVYVRDIVVSDTDMQALENLTRLQRLALDNVAITDRDLAHLRGCRELETLSLRGTQVAGEGITALRDLSNLREFILLSDHVSSSGVQAIAQLRKLEILVIGKAESATIAEHVAELSQLRYLAIIGGTLTSTEAERLHRAPRLRRLHLQKVVLPVDSLSSLVEIPQLGSMLLSQCDVDQQSLRELWGRLRPEFQLSVTGNPANDSFYLRQP